MDKGLMLRDTGLLYVGCCSFRCLYLHSLIAPVGLIQLVWEESPGMGKMGLVEVRGEFLKGCGDCSPGLRPLRGKVEQRQVWERGPWRLGLGC